MFERLHAFLFRLEAERAHNIGSAIARTGQRWAHGYLSRQFEFESDRLRTELFGIPMANPFGIAAGFDKNALLIPFWQALGCGFAEVGSVTGKKSRGNPRPRAFRLPEEKAIINRMGLNNDGSKRIGKRLARYDPAPLPLAVSIAKTHDPAIEGQDAVEDFTTTFSRCAPHVSMVVLNLSCPNTREGRTFEDPNALDDLLKYIMPLRAALEPAPPVLLKLSPPITDRVVLDSEVDEILAVAALHGVDGYVATNTDPGRELLQHTSPEVVKRIGPGGLSGLPLRSRSTQLVRYLYRKTEGSTPIIGVGGVGTGLDAYAKIRAGASLVQLYTSLVYQGPGVFRQLKMDLDQLLERDGFASVQEAVGADAWD
ncbi:MAG: quinone-dependent dihydroorotate dehydrogenase [Rhodothermales bacterium]|nr:quinone-dependent dihydroorotate dehydrogenase [Rhodothermales bacterium]MBO6778926.1 quinone-dependent dihydroorotate dehydrogenase [Rhodothermales bacterium]